MNALETHVLRIIGENLTTPDVFTDTAAGIAPIRDSLNDAIQELCILTGAYKRQYVQPLYTDRQFYRLNWEKDYFGWVVECWDRKRNFRLEQTDFIRLSNDDPAWMKRSGDPWQYFPVGTDVIGFYYKPASEGAVLELQCVCIPKAYGSDTDPIKLREAYQRAAVYYAVCEFYASRGDAKRAVEYFDKYMETAGLMALKPETQERIYQIGTNRQNDNVLK